MFDGMWNWLARRIAAEQLHHLDDRLLADMGLERGLIDQSIARGMKLRAGAEVEERRRECDLSSECGPPLAHYATAGR